MRGMERMFMKNESNCTHCDSIKYARWNYKRQYECALFSKLSNFYVEHNLQHDVNRLSELRDESTSHDWVCCINPVHSLLLSLIFI